MQQSIRRPVSETQTPTAAGHAPRLRTVTGNRWSSKRAYGQRSY